MHKRFMAEPYGCPIEFTDDPKYMQKVAGAYPTDCAGQCCYGSHGVLVGVFDADKATLVHELTHACLYILHRCGMNPMDSNGEAMAYLMDNLYAKGLVLWKAKS